MRRVEAKCIRVMGKKSIHMKALSNGGGYGKSNQRVVARKTNRSYKRNAKNKPI